MLEYDDLMQAKEVEIALLNAQLSAARTLEDGCVNTAASIEAIKLETMSEKTFDTPISRNLGTSTAQKVRLPRYIFLM